MRGSHDVTLLPSDDDHDEDEDDDDHEEDEDNDEEEEEEGEKEDECMKVIFVYISQVLIVANIIYLWI